MRKIPTIFLRDLKLKCTPVTDEINPECQWVFDGEGFATRKIDGVNIKISGSDHFIRIKPKTDDYIEALYKPLEATDSKYICYAVMNGWPKSRTSSLPDAIYEAYGEGIRGNPEKVEGYHMVRIAHLDNKPGGVDHALVIKGVPRSYRGLMGYLATHDIEGIVFHHRDGRMAKIKTRDFYHLSRP